METISINLTEDMISAVDETAQILGMKRSAFFQHAIWLAFQHYNIKILEQKHRQGYIRKPVEKGEFDVWEDEQVWMDDYDEGK